jgi:hypothetical protein
MLTDRKPLMREMDGYMVLGMGKEALRLARKQLSSAKLEEAEFVKALTAVFCMSKSLKQWRVPVQQAYERLSVASQKHVRYLMLSFFHCLNDAKAALEFATTRPSDFDELLFSMGTYLNLGELKKAKRLAMIAERAVKSERDGMALNGLHDALADYYARVGKWEEAAWHWSKMDLSEPLGDNGLVELLELKVADAIKTARTCINALDEYRKRRRGELDIALPGNELRIIKDARAKLSRHLKHLERVLPKDRQTEFGMVASR